MVRKILLLGAPALYEKSRDAKPEELEELRQVVRDFHQSGAGVSR